MSEEDGPSPYERFLASALHSSLDRLVKAEQLELVPEHTELLVAELLAAAGNAETPKRMIKKIVRTLVDSSHVDEVYASDDELSDVFQAAIDRGP
jgi:hypothetical protein